MSFGLRVMGAAGQKQIDQNSIVYVEHSRGSVNFSAASSFDQHRRISIALPEPSALVAVRLRGSSAASGFPSLHAGYRYYSFSYLTGGEFRATCIFYALEAWSSEVPFLEYIVFTKAVPAATGWGMNIYTDAGALAFSSNSSNKYCRFLQLADYIENASTQSLAGLSSSISDYLIVPHCTPCNVRYTGVIPNLNVFVGISVFDRYSGLNRQYLESYAGLLSGATFIPNNDFTNYLFPGNAWNSVSYTLGFGRNHLIRVTS